MFQALSLIDKQNILIPHLIQYFKQLVFINTQIKVFVILKTHIILVTVGDLHSGKTILCVVQVYVLVLGLPRSRPKHLSVNDLATTVPGEISNRVGAAG